MRSKGPARTLLIIWLCAVIAVPGSIPAESPNPSITPETILQEHGIRITRKAVFAALSSSNAEVRGAAAEVAMQRWPKDAIQPIELALLKERLVWNKIEMADDLYRLGDPLGQRTLVNVCHDLTVAGTARMAAANRLVSFKDDSCRDSVLNTLESPSHLQDTDAKEKALLLAPSLMGQFGTKQYDTVFQLLVKSLRDPGPNVRVIASAMLGQIGDPAAIPSLEAAIAKEQDEGNRLWMTNSLQKLKSKNQRPLQ